MHVEVSVALNFVISYLYNKLPRRRVDLFGEELEQALKSKFKGHWYPENPNKGSGYRCIKANCDEIDPVLSEAAIKAGLDIGEIRNYLPDELTLWIDPMEVSYKLGERTPVKVLYNDVCRDDDTNDCMDREVQAANKTFNPEAQTFTPEGQMLFPNEFLSFNNHDASSFCSDPTQSFQTIDSLSSSLSNLSLSPSSPVPPNTWSTNTSPTSQLFGSALQSPSGLGPNPSYVSHNNHNNHSSHSNHRANNNMNSPARQIFTAATFAQTKFGSTKLKNQAKRPNRLSPTEFGNYFRQAQRNYTGPQRPRSLSPRDPRVEFLIDQQQRLIYNQQQQHYQHQQHQQHINQSMPLASQYSNQHMHYQHPQQHQQQHQQQHHQQHHQHQQHQQLSPTAMYPELYRQQSPGKKSSSNFSSPHLSPHLSPMSPQGNTPAFYDVAQSSSSLPSPKPGPVRPTSLAQLGRPKGLGGLNSSMPSPGSVSQSGVLSPDNQKSFVDGLGVTPVGYSHNLQHLLMAN